MSDSRNKSWSGFKNLIFQDTEGFIKYWEKQKKKGIIIYTAINIIWAIFIFVFWCLVFIRVKGNFLGWEGKETLPVAILIGLVGGSLAALGKRFINDSRYRKITNNTHKYQP
ncbi:MAG: hypothetical protein K0R84_1833 [Clostridia bacterium]|nr:hypothetical protein [Clostridia bacterium]